MGRSLSSRAPAPAPEISTQLNTVAVVRGTRAQRPCRAILLWGSMSAQGGKGQAPPSAEQFPLVSKSVLHPHIRWGLPAVLASSELYDRRNPRTPVPLLTCMHRHPVTMAGVKLDSKLDFLAPTAQCIKPVQTKRKPVKLDSDATSIIDEVWDGHPNPLFSCLAQLASLCPSVFAPCSELQVTCGRTH